MCLYPLHNIDKTITTGYECVPDCVLSSQSDTPRCSGEGSTYILSLSLTLTYILQISNIFPTQTPSYASATLNQPSTSFFNQCPLASLQSSQPPSPVSMYLQTPSLFSPVPPPSTLDTDVDMLSPEEYLKEEEGYVLYFTTPIIHSSNDF